ncbi:MAG: ArsA-related P-loop ATPase [Sulfolobales archaeon]
MKELSPSLSVLNLDNIINTIKYSPGVEEEVFVRELHKIYNVDDYDYALVDTPPTGITLRTLMMPKLYKTWIEKLIEVRERIVSLRYTIARTLGKEFRVEDPVLEKLYGLQKMYGTLWEWVGSSKTSFVIVANPEMMPVLEIYDVIKFLNTEIGVEPKLLVMNKYVNTPESEEALREFNKLHHNKVYIPKVDRPPSNLNDMIELLKYIDNDLVLRAFKSN